MTNIGIGITTRNRRETFMRSYREWVKHLPNGAKIVVVDDASTDPLKEADKRFEEQQGIAGAKNACIAMLDTCEHIFLSDDDVYPVDKDWWRPYVAAPEKHLCLSFEKNSKGDRLSHTVFKTEEFAGLQVYNAPNGCLLYVRNEVVKRVGGMDTAYGKWGFEHVDWSRRIHEAGLTTHPFMDIHDSINLFHVSDYFGEVASSVPVETRVEHATKNKELYESNKGSSKYIEYGRV